MKRDHNGESYKSNLYLPERTLGETLARIGLKIFAAIEIVGGTAAVASGELNARNHTGQVMLDTIGGILFSAGVVVGVFDYSLERDHARKLRNSALNAEYEGKLAENTLAALTANINQEPEPLIETTIGGQFENYARPQDVIAVPNPDYK